MDLCCIIVGKWGAFSFASDNPDDVIAVTNRYRKHIAGVVCLTICFMHARCKQVVLGRRVEYRGVLFIGFFHGAFEVAHNLHFLFEMVCMAYCLEDYVIVLEPTDAYSFSSIAVGNFTD